VKLEFYQLTTTGDREINQDFMSHIINDDYALFVVADGLGGHHAGEKASRFFCEGLISHAETFSKMMAGNPVDTFSDWVSAAVAEMKKLFQDDILADAAYTTCAILYIEKKLVLTAHCGDSRIYRMNPKQILWRTNDHSVPQELFNEGLITEQEIAQHPAQNQLTRSLNVLREHRVEINLYPPIKKGETFLVCSDGFWEHVKKHEFLQLAQATSGKIELAKMVRLAVFRANGKSDNISIQSIRCL
jgi:PPM family protein phosphatase